VKNVRNNAARLPTNARWQIIEWLDEHPDGATADEIAAALGYSLFAMRSRLQKLRGTKWIEDCGLRRRDRNGRNVIVWVVARAAWKARETERPRRRRNRTWTKRLASESSLVLSEV
jgi:predicted ArsR family transcriptional regulator